MAHAEVAQLVEHNLAKVGVAGSSPVFRSGGALKGTENPSPSEAAVAAPPAQSTRLGSALEPSL